MRDKCIITNKSIYLTITEAQCAMEAFRIRYWDSVTRKRSNRRTKKPAQKRAYHCEHCNGYHLTSQEVFKKEVELKKYARTARQNKKLSRSFWSKKWRQT